jgi:uncharacterized protein (DUF58 family)
VAAVSQQQEGFLARREQFAQFVLCEALLFAEHVERGRRIHEEIAEPPGLALLDDAGEEKVIEALAHLRHQGHDVIVFQVFDAAEVQFPFKELMRFADIEGTLAPVTADPPAIRRAYLGELHAFRQRFKNECLKRHIDFVPVDTSTSFDKPLLAYLQKRCGK